MCAISHLYCSFCSRDRTSPPGPTIPHLPDNAPSSSSRFSQFRSPQIIRHQATKHLQSLSNSTALSAVPNHLLFYFVMFSTVLVAWICRLFTPPIVDWWKALDLLRRWRHQRNRVRCREWLQWWWSSQGMGYSSRHIKFKWKDGIHCIVGLLLIVPFTIGYSPHAMSSHIPFNQVLLAGNNHEFKPSYTASFLASTSMVNTESQQQHFLQKSSLTTVTNIARKFSQIAEHDIRFIDSLKELFHSSDASNERDDLHILSQIRMAQERDVVSGHSRYVYFQYFSSAHCLPSTESATVGIATGACLPLGAASYRLHFESDDCSDLSLLVYRDSGCNDFLGNTPLRHQEACVSDLDETSFSASRIMCARSTSIPVKYPSIITSLQHNKTYCTSKSNEFASIRTGVCHEEIVGDQSFQMQCDSKSFSRTTFAGKGKCEGRAYEHEKELTACASYSQVLSASVTTTTNSTVFPKKRKISEVAAKVGSASVVHHSEPSVAKVVSQSDRDALLICDPFSLDDNSQTGFELCKFEACGGENIIISTSHHIGAFCSGDVTMELFHDEDDTLVASNDNYFGKCPQITVVIPDTPNICSLYTVVQACKDGENCRGQVSISRLKMDSIEDSVKRISTPFDLLNVNPFDKVDGEEMVVQKMRCDTFMKDLHTGSSTCIFEACDEKEIVISACGEEGGYCYGNAMFAVYDSALDNVGFSHEACGSCPQYRFKAAKQCQIYSIIQYCASYDDTCGGQLTVNEIQRIPRSKVQDSSLNPQIDEQNEYPRILTQAAIGSSEGCRNSFGSDYCGGYAYGSSAYSTSCYCDDACCKFGDCCSNKLEVCGGCSSSETDSKLVLQSALTTLSYATNNRRSPRTVELICGYYQASSTDSAKSNFATCSLQLCAGEAMIVSGIDSCYGDQYLRLFDEDDNQVSHNDDYAGLCSQLTHSLPATLSTTEPFCRTFTLRKGCHGASLCSGNVKVSVVPEKELSVVLFHSIFENNDKGEDIAQSMMRISCVEQVASSIYFTSGERVSFVKPQLSVNFFTGFHIESKQEYEQAEKEVYTDALFDVAGNEFYFGFICLVALSCLLVACGFIYSRYKTSVIVPPINYRV